MSWRNTRASKIFYAGPILALMMSAYHTVDAQLVGAKTRIAISQDGNFLDKDDWGAGPFMEAMAHAFGVQQNIVYWDYNNKISNTSPNWDIEMETRILEGAKLFNLPSGIFFNCLKDLNGAIARFKKVAEMSSATAPLIIIASGPMEILYRCMIGVAVDKRQYLTFISHSNTNNNRVLPPQMTHTWNHLKALPGGARFLDISDQNAALGTSASGKWDPLKSMGPEYQWLYTTQTEKPGDVSDAGMMWYVLTGSENVTPAQIITKFKNPEKPTSIAHLNRTVSHSSLNLKNGNTVLFKVPESNAEHAGNFISVNGAKILLQK